MSARNVVYCSRCITPNTRPRIVFDADGICNACLHAEKKKSVDWAARKDEFVSLAERRKGAGTWDCIVPWSGGKDSSMIAYRLKHEFGLNPLLVHFSAMLPNDIGHRNREHLIQEGFDAITLRPNQKVMRRLAKRFFIERGNPKVCWEAGKEAFPILMALALGIPLVVYAEHGETEYGGKVLSSDSSRTKDFKEVVENIVGDDAGNWIDEMIDLKNLIPYRYPAQQASKVKDLHVCYFAYYFKWSMYENYRYIQGKIPFETVDRTDGTFTGFDSLDDKIDNLYYYMQYIKFGFGRCVRDASRFIQNGHLTREKALEYARLYDHEFPKSHFEDVLHYMHLSKEEFETIVDHHRNLEIWEKHDGAWRLRFPLPEK